ncbi:unnamed protein product, partial [Owenia fusiformis]
EDSTAGASWMGDDTLDTSANNQADQSSGLASQQDTIQDTLQNLQSDQYVWNLTNTILPGAPKLQNANKMQNIQPKTSQPNKRNPQQCHLCLKVFPSLQNYRYHMNIHTGERPFVCSICNEGFKNPGNLRRHKLKHKNEGIDNGSKP